MTYQPTIKVLLTFIKYFLVYSDLPTSNKKINQEKKKKREKISIFGGKDNFPFKTQKWDFLFITLLINLSPNLLVAFFSDIDECLLVPNSDPCNKGKCINLPGTYTCTCDSGYILNENKTTCVQGNKGKNTILKVSLGKL